MVFAEGEKKTLEMARERHCQLPIRLDQGNFLPLSDGFVNPGQSGFLPTFYG